MSSDLGHQFANSNLVFYFCSMLMRSMQLRVGCGIMCGMDDTQAHTPAHVTIPGKNGGTLRPITSPEQARAMQAASTIARRNNAAKAARSRVTRALAAIDPTIGSSADAWGALVASVAEAVVASAADGKPRGDDMAQVGRAMGMLAQPHEQAQSAAIDAVDSVRELVAEIANALRAGAEAQQREGGGGGGP